MNDSSTPKPWTEAELRSSVIAYLEMLKLNQSGKKFNKKKYYDELAAQFGRTTKAFEYRMQNISYVLSLMGRSWLPGLKPAKNVGSNVGGQIEKLIADAEGITSSVAAFEIAVREAMKKKRTGPPPGNAKPKAARVYSVQYQRDPEVKAWVLKRANGVCECCQRPAPFLNYEGNPYLEAHHVKRLADGGSDTVTNAVAICSNCHAELHYGANAKEVAEKLYDSLQCLIRE
ncbi:HNH endonuclease signature motif containing protein [Leminorella grimontii]|uniref:HNH endonuclease n=1 Tax=Leminorella grimontii TaxID=82981 RepID=UPI0032207DEA